MCVFEDPTNTVRNSRADNVGDARMCVCACVCMYVNYVYICSLSSQHSNYSIITCITFI